MSGGKVVAFPGVTTLDEAYVRAEANLAQAEAFRPKSSVERQGKATALAQLRRFLAALDRRIEAQG